LINVLRLAVYNVSNILKPPTWPSEDNAKASQPKPQGASNRSSNAIGYDEKWIFFSDMGFCCSELDVPDSSRSFQSE
jgi:hypothetical protein